MNSITEHFGRDHETLDKHLAEFQRLKRTDFPAAKQNFKAFLTGLQRHIVWEEEVLFPVFEKRTGMTDAGPTAVMRQEHRRIKVCLDALHDKVRAADPDCDAEEEALIDLLAVHNHKEEGVLYPAIDGFLGEGGAASIKKELDAIPEERYASCCAGHHH